MILQQYQVADLAMLRDIGPERIRHLHALLVGANPSPLDSSGLTRLAAEALGDRSEFAPRLVAILMFLADQCRCLDMTVGEVLDDLDASLHREADWEDRQFALWQTLRTDLQAVLEQGRISYALKALGLSYDYANVLSDARIIADIRPVFNEAATEIEGAVISYTLRLEYSSGNTRHGMSIALDEVDLKGLLSECTRAVTKAQTAGRILNAGSPIPTMIIGVSDVDR